MSELILTNKSHEILYIAIEPEGSIFEIPSGEQVKILVNEDTLPLHLNYEKFKDENIISIWPNRDFPIVIYKGKDLLE